MKTTLVPTAMFTMELIKEAKRQAYAEVADWFYTTYKSQNGNPLDAGDIYEAINKHFCSWDYAEECDNERE